MAYTYNLKNSADGIPQRKKIKIQKVENRDKCETVLNQPQASSRALTGPGASNPLRLHCFVVNTPSCHMRISLHCILINAQMLPCQCHLNHYPGKIHISMRTQSKRQFNKLQGGPWGNGLCPLSDLMV